MNERPPQPLGNDWKTWARRLEPYLTQMKTRLGWKRGDERPADNGILLWDEINKEPVISIDGVFKPLVIHDGHAIVSSTTDITPAAINTAYAISWDSIALAEGVTLGTPASRVVFSEGGTFLMAFSVQITSTSASTKTLWFWPRINGSDVTGATMKVSIHNNSETTVLSRSALIDVVAGDYLEAFYEVNDTTVTLESAPAGTNAPATPSVILSVTRIHQ